MGCGTVLASQLQLGIGFQLGNPVRGTHRERVNSAAATKAAAVRTWFQKVQSVRYLAQRGCPFSTAGIHHRQGIIQWNIARDRDANGADDIEQCPR